LPPIEGFFKRGREVARLADRKKPIPAERVIAYEHPEDLARILTTAKIALFRAIKEQSGSITDIATRLKRDRRFAECPKSCTRYIPDLGKGIL
jgi:predicted transcriptional regulator